MSPSRLADRPDPRSAVARAHWAVLAAGALGACGCGAPPEAAEPSCALGTGIDAYAPLEEGDPIDVYAGAQGGFHVFASVRATGIEPGDPVHFDDANPWLDFVVYLDGTPIDWSDPVRIGLLPVEEDGADGAFERYGRSVVLDTVTVAPLEEFDGTPIDVEVVLTGADGTACSERLSLVARAVL